MLRSRLYFLNGLVLFILVSVSGPTLSAQEVRFPFPIGEALEYRVHVAMGGNVGTGQMRVEGPSVDRGVTVWKLHFEMEARRGPIRARDHTTSWLDPQRFAITRFEKLERHPLSRSHEEVEIDRASGTWRDGKGPVTPLGAPEPLDELSFLYFLRTLPLDRDTTIRLDRHFDAARNPIIIRVMGIEEVKTPAGVFRTRVVEMDVRDPKRYRGTGTVRLNIDLDECHVLVKMESRMPILGVTTLTLIGWVHPPRYPGALLCEG